jgi:hypothetical protein
MSKTRMITTALLVALALVGTLAVPAFVAADNHMHSSKPFAGPKANKGTVSHDSAKRTLTLSDDFVVPDTPDPHWRVMDSKGNVYDLAKLKVKNDGYNKTVTLPAYVKDVKKVIIWCAFAETNLGEAEFEKAVK